MKYTTAFVKQDKKTKGKPWRAVLKYKDPTKKSGWAETSLKLPEAKGKKEAQRMADAWLIEMNAIADNMPSMNSDKTVDEMYKEYLLHQLNTGEIEKSTYTNSMYSYNKYIKPYIGNYVFATIDAVAINNWLTKLNSLNLSQNTIHTTYARIKKLFNHYYDIGELVKNPFRGVKTPKKGEAKVSHLTDKQYRDVLSAVEKDYTPKDPMYVGILLALFAGLRREEIVGLRWRDINFNANTISVRSAIGLGGEDGSYTKAPKNNSSNRTFPMMKELREALRKRKEEINPKDNWFVCGHGENFMTPTTYSKKFKNFAKNNNLVDAYGNRIIPHALRHNFATVGIRAGVDIASLSLMMGHASRAMTLDTYGDANADALILASSKLDDTFTEFRNKKEKENSEAIESDKE